MDFAPQFRTQGLVQPAIEARFATPDRFVEHGVRVRGVVPQFVEDPDALAVWGPDSMPLDPPPIRLCERLRVGLKNTGFLITK